VLIVAFFLVSYFRCINVIKLFSKLTLISSVSYRTFEFLVLYYLGFGA